MLRLGDELGDELLLGLGDTLRLGDELGDELLLGLGDTLRLGDELRLGVTSLLGVVVLVGVVLRLGLTSLLGVVLLLGVISLLGVVVRLGVVLLGVIRCEGELVPFLSGLISLLFPSREMPPLLVAAPGFPVEFAFTLVALSLVSVFVDTFSEPIVPPL